MYTTNKEVIGAQHKREIDLIEQICHFFVYIIPKHNAYHCLHYAFYKCTVITMYLNS